MKLNVTVRETLPPLAWLLELDGAPERHRLFCGSSVILSEGAFFEGAWPGALAAMDFAEKPEAFGSGGVRTEAGWTIVPPSHTLESLFTCRDGTKLFISNALPFLLAHRGDGLDPTFLDYHRVFFDILGGLAHSPIRFPSRRCTEIRGYYYENLAIGADLAVTVAPKPRAPGFAAFADYRAYLAAVVEAVLDNAADPLRPNPYRPLATISQGYDSPACAALAREAGCREAVTHGTARRAFGVVDSDSGVEIAKALDMAVTVIDRGAYLERQGLVAPEAEFLCHGLEGTDVNYLAFEPKMRHCVLFTGCHGDTMWDKHKVPSDVIKRGDLDGGSLGEYRRRLDFIHLPLPYVGALRHHDVVAISNAPEMAPWSIGGDYDRPIPRRILEEAGVPRDAFGQAKKATSISFFGFLPGMHERLTGSSRRALEAFAVEWRPRFGARLRLRRNQAIAILVDWVRVAEKRLHPARRLGLEPRLDKALHILDTQNLDTPEAVRALHWSMGEMIKRYTIAEAAPDPALVPARPLKSEVLAPLLGAVQLFGAMLP
ncbi:hypothetical protein [Dongia sedimenti]|uniref:Uncharacterized protein n=1 Tax=Dongia sedimenti TaxID=3064282 RepID=A0ABU0YPB0_9PROT|nr:hypothetical protein [Rhodospirillaceae bacterium R-7]